MNEITDAKNVVVVETRDTKTEISMARDILETEMNSGLVFDKEEKMSRTELVQKFIEAGESVFTVQFNKKVDDKYIKSVLDAADPKSDLKKIAKDIITGQEALMTGHFANAEN